MLYNVGMYREEHAAGPEAGGEHEPPDRSGGGAERWLASALDAMEMAQAEEVPRSEVEAAVGLLGRIQARAASMLCTLAREVEVSDPDSYPPEVLRQGARMSGRQAKQMARLAGQLPDLPAVEGLLASGDIPFDNARMLGNAAEKCGPEAVEADDELLRQSAQLPADTFGRRVRDWINQKLVESGLDPIERQRRVREAKLWVEDSTGLGVLMAKLPSPQFNHVQQAVDARYLRLLQRDAEGGGDPEMVRTPHQRKADVVYELLTGLDAVNGEPLEEGAGGAARRRPQLVITADIGVIDGTDPKGHCEIIGAGPAPRNVLRSLSPDTELCGMIFNRPGRVLWMGRRQRLGNAAQRLAVAVRDGGCFECGAPMHLCELHHVREWHRRGGSTDVDNLVAVCRRHHRWLETENLAVRWTGGRWEARPRDGPP